MSSSSKTLRLVFPQWQGGQNTPYYLGAELLNFLAPSAERNGHITKTVPVTPPPAPFLKQSELEKRTAKDKKDGIQSKEALLEQARRAQRIVQEVSPDGVVIFGGDCLVELAPFAYLADKYNQGPNKLGILWMDAHPDITVPKEFSRAHTYVLGLLLHRKGSDADFLSMVPTPVPTSQVMFMGVEEEGMPAHEKQYLQSEPFGFVSAAEVREGNAVNKVISWMRSQGITHLAIHLDLDMIDPRDLRVLLFSNPNEPSSIYDGITQGKVRLGELIAVFDGIQDYAKRSKGQGSEAAAGEGSVSFDNNNHFHPKKAARGVSVVGMGVTEHFPWDSINLRRLLYRMPLFGDAKESYERNDIYSKL